MRRTFLILEFSTMPSTIATRHRGRRRRCCCSLRHLRLQFYRHPPMQSATHSKWRHPKIHLAHPSPISSIHDVPCTCDDDDYSKFRRRHSCRCFCCLFHHSNDTDRDQTGQLSTILHRHSNNHAAALATHIFPSSKRIG